MPTVSSEVRALGAPSMYETDIVSGPDSTVSAFVYKHVLGSYYGPSHCPVKNPPAATREAPGSSGRQTNHQRPRSPTTSITWLRRLAALRQLENTACSAMSGWPRSTPRMMASCSRTEVAIRSSNRLTYTRM